MAVKKKTPVLKRASVAKKRVATKKKVAVRQRMVVRKKGATRTAAPGKPKSIAAKQTKSQILQAIAEDTGLSRKQVADVFGSLCTLIRRHIQKRGSGEFAIPDAGVKIRRVVKPARKARMGRNPATGESIKIAAKRASIAVKVSALKALKDTLA